MILQPPRGQIYDRWGNLLAGNEIVYEVGVELIDVGEGEEHALALAISGVLDLDYDAVYEAVSQPYQPGVAVYATLAKGVKQEKIDVFLDYYEKLENDETGTMPDLSGLVLSRHIAAQLSRAGFGLQYSWFCGLRPVPTQYSGRPILGLSSFTMNCSRVCPNWWRCPTTPIWLKNCRMFPPGPAWVLTIDRQIQAMVEELLDDAVKRYDAKAGTIVIMDPETGEILAIGTTPRLDLNEYWRYPEVYPQTEEIKVPFNRAVSQTYEPGSVFKVLTVAAALDAEAIDRKTTYFDPGYFDIGGITIHNWDNAAYGEVNMTECLQYSLNVCLAWIGTELGAEQFYDYMEAFGFGHRTGVDLAGEATGRLKIPGDGDWYPADLGTNTFGQGIAVTPIQMMMAISALANDGQMVVPHLVRSMVDGGQQFDFHSQVAGQPISAETAQIITEMLAYSLEAEVGNRSRIPGARLPRGWQDRHGRNPHRIRVHPRNHQCFLCGVGSS